MTKTIGRPDAPWGVMSHEQAARGARAEFGVDREGRLLWANSLGHHVLADGGWLALDEGWLRPASSNQRSRFVLALGGLALLDGPRMLHLPLLHRDGRVSRLKLVHRAGGCAFDPSGLAYARLTLELPEYANADAFRHVAGPPNTPIATEGS
jgi:hypothetical protein